MWVVDRKARGDAEKRQKQAKALKDFAANAEIPVIVCGDLNFDYSTKPKGEKGNEAMKIALADGELVWVETPKDVWTNSNPKYFSILDFFLVNDEAQRRWKLKADVVVRENDFPNNDVVSDHRPVLLELFYH